MLITIRGTVLISDRTTGHYYNASLRLFQNQPRFEKAQLNIKIIARMRTIEQSIKT
jgi:hypothetical protein